MERGFSIFGGDKVDWKEVCMPKDKGGLGIKHLGTWNKASMIKHIWNLLMDKDSLWVAWVNKHLIKNRSFWQILVPSNPSWTWQKILHAREWCRGVFRSRVGNGKSTSLWYDYWMSMGERPIDLLSHRFLATTSLPWDARWPILLWQVVGIS